VVLEAFSEVSEAPDSSEPDAPVVAAALPSVDDCADLEPVDSGPSVIVPLAEPDSVEEGAADCDDSGGDDVSDCDDFGGDDVSDGASETIEILAS
jgi:hypothetical protein